VISVVIVQHNHAALTRSAVESLRARHTQGFETIVVDNGSTEPGARETAGALPGCRVVLNADNQGFGRANNAGAREAAGDIILFLNNDTRIPGIVLPAIEEHFARFPRCGAAGPRLANPDGTAQASAGAPVTLRTLWTMKTGHAAYGDGPARECGWVSGAAMAVRKDVFHAVGGFDERYFMYFEDIDLCARIRRAGYEIHFLPEVTIEHLGGGSQPGGLSPRVRTEYRRSQIMYFLAHGSAVDNLVLRLYLLARFLPQRVSRSAENRAVASTVVSMALGHHDEHRA